MPAHDGAKSPEELIALVERAIAQGGWLVLLFHGVGGDHLPVELGAHQALLAHLARHRTDIWTERFGTIAKHIKSERDHQHKASAPA